MAGVLSCDDCTGCQCPCGDNTDIPPSTGPLDKDNPELISVLKTHTAYVGVMQQARMNGVIAYIDRISDGAGTTNLRWIQDDYLAAASSISLLYTSDEITAAREEMRAQSIRFSDETKTQMAAFNGNDADLRVSTNATEADAETTFVRMPDSIMAEKRQRTTGSLQHQRRETCGSPSTLLRGRVWISLKPVNFPTRSMPSEPSCRIVVVKNKNGAVLSLNSGIAKLNSQFRTTVDESLKNREIQLKAAAIDGDEIIPGCTFRQRHTTESACFQVL